MKTLRSMSISRRLSLILLVAVAMLVILGLLMLRQLHGDLYQAKAQKTQHVVQTAAGVLAYYQGLEAAGTLSREAAQQQALQVVRGLRYDKDDYFWINDLGPKMIMHPTNPKLDGQDLSAIRDPDGFAVFNEMVALARSQDAGSVNYRWPKPGASEPVAKTSYIQLFKPWGWIIGSGVYIDDVQAEFARQVRDASLLGLGIAVLMALLVLLIARSIARPLQDAVQAMGNIASGESDLTRRLDTHGRDELTHLGEHFNRFNGKLQGVVGQLQGAAHALAQSASHVGDNAGQAQARSVQQSLQMDQVATAVNEVTYAVQDVAKTAEQAANEMHAAQVQVDHGQQAIHSSLEQIDRLSSTIDQAVQVIRELAGHSTRIGGVLEVIRSIAEQTNLLALNAAIEAARAGEQGRGFAVVADEVRLLAQRTAQSTAEIQTMIEHLQSQSEAAVKAIDTSSEASRQTVHQAREAGTSLDAISQALNNLTALNASIASATLQQAHVVEEINRNVLDTAGLSQQTAEAARQSSDAGASLARLSEDLEQLLRQFKV
ncbi:Methyl-accepting chemotaxis protein 4 [Pseudomonas putida]|uniref:Methyl-accepting chemotaxis protein n=2 Tax=Pseudomonas TaxID=286 RepID=A0A6S5TXX7_PSEPU|nr:MULTISPECIES: methyl-accepting chemotaxis protein [Pseudomonas]MCO7621978.1 methyl-accepting chemotaxis protein [Pseudomonas guariconensis]MEB3841071.1 methyl-accepting chemotaxis protein [Pseudomonas guariconensis]MEB3873939.1 methyl-accepting chemotaxis protein [Pseudomonas guariconensis]MEB3877631.1 methyl-accepting chemotaxis protein [Pseudomonas guariconensis]MEB3894081.1 methyl-accepting chemotaxis protein [Pseudomonas guariconensis]